ncbi:GSCFA domain-containing protein [Capnocytophaga sp. ARDL2]|uniref:GSCFA domain-containing protein n=1 Tax=Capnocytophaga sp. ARDL2 TaxID=3238809 RepID=UPI0035575C70
MKFSTEINIQPLEKKLTYDSKIVSIGSCFAENISKKLSYFKWRNTVNPTGILFHPQAIKQLFHRTIHKDFFQEKDIFLHREIWCSFECHSSLNQLTKEDFLSKVNQKIIDFYHQLKEATHLIITLGTAWAYQWKESGNYVANCHKIPQNQFTKHLLSVEEIESELAEINQLIRTVNPELQCIFTISPVRHIKDGIIENQRSKSHLITALHNFLDKNCNKNYYFPTYEMLMDELRDYRFYANDLIHPSDFAIDFVWEKFKNNCIDSSVYMDMKLVQKINSGLMHRPFNQQTNEYVQFVETLKNDIQQINAKHPFMDFEMNEI